MDKTIDKQKNKGVKHYDKRRNYFQNKRAYGKTRRRYNGKGCGCL